MHEMSYMVKLIDMAASEAHCAPDEHIISLTAEVGELTGVLPEYLERYFFEAASGTPCEGAKFHIISVPAEAKCSACGDLYHPSRENDYRCPKCHSTDSVFVRGRELSIVEIRTDKI